MTSKERFLVTGGSGFIGRYVCLRLLELGYEVQSFDLKKPIDDAQSIPTIFGDIEDFDKVRDVVRSFQPHYLIHLAAFASVTSSAWTGFSSIWNGTLQVARAFSESASARRFVNVSTQLVIGPGDQPKDLRDYRPYTKYGEAKAEAERTLEDLDVAYERVHVRPTNIWGPYHANYPSSVWKYLERGWYLHPITGSPVVRTYGYVRNCANQIISVALHSEPLPGRILYSGDAAIPSEEWLDAFSLALAGRPTRRLQKSILTVMGKIGDLVNATGLRAPIDSQRVLRMSTNYVVPLGEMNDLMMWPVTSLGEGVAETVGWYLNRGADRVQLNVPSADQQ